MAIRRVTGEQSSSGPTCSVTEFGKVGAADLAEVAINGRYPQQGFSINHESDMMIRVIAGTGAIALRGVGYELHPGNVIHIDKETPYYYEGEQLLVLLISSPAWSKEQYEIVN